MRFLIYIIIAGLISGCATKLPPGENLYVGASVKVDKSVKAKERKAIRNELSVLVRPRPNSKFLGIRLKLWAKHLPFIGKKVGEPPVLASSVNFDKNNEVLQNRMQNRGYFQADVKYDTVTKRRKTSVTFTVIPGPQYKIGSISFPTDSSDLSKAIAATAKRSLLKAGDPYDLSIIKLERERIDGRLKDVGYYYFSPDYIIANVDSTIGGNQVLIMIRVKPETPANARSIYRVNDIIVHADYSLATDTSSAKPDSSLYNGYFIIDPNKKFKPTVFDRTLVIHPGEVYSRQRHNLSLNRLVSLGVYKFVKVQFEDVQTDTARLLNAYYYLTPFPKKSIRAEVGGLTRSTNSTGSEITLSWRNRNTFGGAELLTISAYAGVERQISGQQPAVSTNRFGGDINLTFPRITFPLRFNTSSEFVPQTKMNVGYELYTRSDQYSLSSFRANIGYVFKEHLRNEHQLNIISVNYVYPSNITEAFQSELDRNPTLKRSIERQFIIGSNYNYNYNSQIRPNHRTNNLYFNGNVDLSGNLLGLIVKKDADDNNRRTINGIPFAQYVRLEPELRHYLRFNHSKTNMLASRIIVGVGLPYGNSISMPFSRSFFAGGTNSIRAFRARSLGPGTFYGGNADTARNFLPDQPGDIKLEVNTELRFNITSIFNGAFFIDAGNVWTLREDSTRPGSKFTGRFINQLAVGAGVGLRVDLQLVILRLDVAFPIRKPWLQNNSTIFKNTKETIFNLAIGYPF